MPQINPRTLAQKGTTAPYPRLAVPGGSVMATCCGDMVLSVLVPGPQRSAAHRGQGSPGDQGQESAFTQKMGDPDAEAPQLVLLNALVTFRVRSLRACLAGSVFPDD